MNAIADGSNLLGLGVCFFLLLLISLNELVTRPANLAWYWCNNCVIRLQKDFNLINLLQFYFHNLSENYADHFLERCFKNPSECVIFSG